MKVAGSIAACILTIAVLVYGSFAIYEGSWSLASHNVQHQLGIQKQIVNGQGQIAHDSFSFQSGLGQQIVTGIQSVQTDTTEIGQATESGDTATATNLKGQREYDASQVCYDATQVNKVLPAANVNTTWIDTNCLDGNLKTTSQFYYVGN